MQSQLDQMLKTQASIISYVILGKFKNAYKFLLYSVFSKK
ncbi:hypothetical protein CSUNSWCD_1731 [Campylobacter showae CSUNSWCD]|uniref:Uncharacterized protein n=1 Tax=Campylobacter showae CSUNSWCD TaxID=1244083 RepID=M5ISE4_9BACT|nr:hypothetical protein CSUNSWCD_1731 [Campylobacter showae CSUNSWCD]